MIRRRTLLTAAPALALGAGLMNLAPTLAAPAALTGETTLKPRSGKAPRIVIAGGGWGGMTAARYLKQELPEADVILLERNPFFWSAPFSNKWLIDVVDTGPRTTTAIPLCNAMSRGSSATARSSAPRRATWITTS
jgi:hypothetical protein